jgi:hypothetical protein
MGATEEQMRLLSDANVTHVSYILILYSVAFLLYLFVNILLYVYASYAWPDDESNGLRTYNSRDNSSGRSLSVAGPSSAAVHGRKVSILPNGGVHGAAVNGAPRLPKHRGTDSQQVRDAEEFELEGLISDEGEDEGDDSPRLGKKEGVVALP